MGASPGPSTSLAFLLNGNPVSIDDASPEITLLDFLRARGLTGAKEGCAEGECGACAVAVVVNCDGRSAYRVVNSCLLLLPAVAGREVYTVESLAAAGELSEVQQALARAGGSQCGYCTPGFVMSLFAEQYRVGRDGPCEPLALAGNLCRCTGYRPIRDAALGQGPAPPGPFRDRLDRAAPVLGPVTNARFCRPSTIDEAVHVLAARPGATPIAGGTDLAVDSNLRGRRFPYVVSLEAIPELQTFADGPASVTIGAALPLTDIGLRWRGAPAVVGEWLELFASPPIRNRATLGGNLVTASPIGDGAPLLSALDAVVHVAGTGGRRRIPVSSLFPSYRRTALEPGEILTAIEIPKPLPAFVRFYKIAKRRLDDISTVAAALAVDLDPGGRVRRARFAFGGMAPTPVRLADAEAVVTGEMWSDTAVARVQDVIARTLAPITDHRGSKEYRLEVAKSVVEKFWWESRP